MTIEWTKITCGIRTGLLVAELEFPRVEKSKTVSQSKVSGVLICYVGKNEISSSSSIEVMNPQRRNTIKL